MQATEKNLQFIFPKYSRYWCKQKSLGVSGGLGSVSHRPYSRDRILEEERMTKSGAFKLDSGVRAQKDLKTQQILRKMDHGRVRGGIS